MMSADGASSPCPQAHACLGKLAHPLDVAVHGAEIDQ